MVNASGNGRLGAVVRLAAVALAAAALLASASSNANRPPDAPQSYGAYGPPAPQQMDTGRALGLWKSSFGAVKLERDPGGGATAVRGVWVYDRAGQEVIGYFAGGLSGNVLQFRWNEPSQPSALVGEGYLVFDPSGRSFSGKWWTTNRDRGGDWNGWRAEDAAGGDAQDGQGAEPAPTEPPPDEPPPDQTGDTPAPRPGGVPRTGPAEQAPAPPPSPETI